MADQRRWGVAVCHRGYPHDARRRLRANRHHVEHDGLAAADDLIKRAGLPGLEGALNALTPTLATELAGTGILVNPASPGWVRTDLGGPRAPRSVEEGADTPVWLATLPDDGPNGGFFLDRKPLEW